MFCFAYTPELSFLGQCLTSHLETKWISLKILSDCCDVLSVWYTAQYNSLVPTYCTSCQLNGCKEQPCVKRSAMFPVSVASPGEAAACKKYLINSQSRSYSLSVQSQQGIQANWICKTDLQMSVAFPLFPEVGPSVFSFKDFHLWLFLYSITYLNFLPPRSLNTLLDSLVSLSSPC